MPKLTILTSRALRPHALHIVAVLALAAACNTAPGGSPPPGTSAPPSGSPTGSPTLTPQPTATPLPSPTFGAEQIEHPTGATDIVLRMETGGGFVPMEFFATAAPTFTLYGDGTVIFKSSDPGPPFGTSGPLPPFLIGTMSEENVQALLAFALGQGRLLGARQTYDSNMCADCPTTSFVLNAGGLEKVVSINGLSEVQQQGPDATDLAGFAQLQQLLVNFEAEAANGTADNVVAYDADMFRVTMYDGTGAQPSSQPIDWPWDDITPDDFPSGDEPGAILHMDREHVAQIVEVPNGGALAIWALTPDGQLVQFAVRPLLPEEQALVGE